jgi:DNA-binding transcriptional regulator PaaX
LLEQRPDAALNNHDIARSLRRWAAAERTAWQAAMEIDPLLPKRLLPSDYLGQRAWGRRMEVLRQAGKQLQTFSQKMT